MRRRRVVVSAFAFSPARGSEPGIGWNIGSRLARWHDVTILCCPELGGENHRAEIEEYLRQNGPIPGLEIAYVEAPLLSRMFQKPLISFATPFYFIGYASWQRAAWMEAARLHRSRMFDLAQQVTITSFREPGYLWKLGIPFVWGPFGGAANIPWSYFRLFSPRDRIFYGLKNVVNSLHRRFKFRSRRAARRASQIFASTPVDQAMVKNLWGLDSQVMLETGSPSVQGRPSEYDGSGPLRLVWSGLHIGRKALPLLLEALKDIRKDGWAERVTLKVLGSGLRSEGWRDLAKKLGVDDRITWTGQLPREQALEQMRDCDVFVFTSVQESTSSVVMEAMALGLPVICHDAYGMGVAVNETCGIKVPLEGPEASRRGFANAIRSLLSDPVRVRRLSAGALARARELSWDTKAERIAAVYDQLLSR